MKPSTKRIIVYFIASVFFTLLIEYFTHALTFGKGLLTFGCIFVCCLINELCFFYLPKKWFGEDVDKPVKNESGLPEWKIKLMVAAIALAASIAEPPPIPIMKSALNSDACFPILKASRSGGLAGIPDAIT